MRKSAFIKSSTPINPPLKKGGSGDLKSSIRNRLILLTMMLITASFLITHDLMACGPFFDQTTFTYSVHPDLPLDNYANGNLGIIQPTYARVYLYVAYRYYSGVGFDQEEQKALVSMWSGRNNLGWGYDGTEWIKQWLEARSKVPNAGQSPEIGVYSNITGDWWVNYLNYNEDSFVTATKTLNDLIDKFGVDNPDVLDWVQAQDKVFSNSTKLDFSVNPPQVNTPSIPDPAKPDADPLIKAHRAYQIASANFYAKRFDEAEKMFREIANDKSSPWSKIAPYLVARTLVRKATLTMKPGEVDIGTLTQASEELNDILSNNDLSGIHPASQRLLSFVTFRLDPEGTLQELVGSILKKGQGENLGQQLDDYTKLLDKFLDKYRYDAARSVSRNIEATEKLKNAFNELSEIREDDVTDWIITFQFQGDPWLEHAIEKWSETSSPQWLVSALSKINPDNPKVTELIEAADKVEQNSPAFTSVTFHKLRLMAESGEKDKARNELDSLLKQRNKFPLSSRNLFFALRLKLSRNLDEFLEYAPRIPTGLTIDMDSRELLQEYNQELKNFADTHAFLDVDSSRILDEQMPLSLLKGIATNKLLPENIRKEIAKGAWLRAILVDNDKMSREMSPILASLVPELKQYLDAYLSEKDSEAKKFTAVYMILKFPGLQPYAGSGLPRRTPIDKIDNFRDNWWASFKPEEETGIVDREYYSMGYAITGPMRVLYPENTPWSPDFLTPSQKASAKEEWKILYQIETAPNYLCRVVINWAKKHPDDPRVPETLYLAVRSTRYGITDKSTSNFSKQAFQILHKQYPKSEWAVKTKYWF